MKIKNLIYLGCLLLILCFIYDVLFINIPLQDPTAEIIEKRNRQYGFKDVLFYSGLIFTLCGISAVIFNKKKA